jgi:hypothetical protein
MTAKNPPTTTDIPIEEPSMNGEVEAHDAAPEPYDPFAPDQLRYDDEEFSSGDVPTKRHNTLVKVRKPGRQEWVRAHPSQQLQGKASLFVRENEELMRPELYLVPKDFRDLFRKEHLTPVYLRLMITSLGTEFLWDLKQPKGGIKTDYHISIDEAVDAAEESWMRLIWLNSTRAYDYETAEGDLGDPEWQHPERSWADWLKLGFKSRVITGEDHEVYREYKGRGADR